MYITSLGGTDLSRLPKSTALPGWPVGTSMLIHSVILSSCTFLLWSSLHTLFNIYLNQGPVRRGRLASEKSMQQDETLLSGLRDQERPLTQFLALEELYFIASDSEQSSRRQKIFEAGAPEATVWLSIVEANLFILKNHSNKLHNLINSGSIEPPKPPVQAPSQSPPADAKPLHVLQGNIFKPTTTPQSPLDRFRSQPSSISENQQQIAEVQKLSHDLTTSAVNHLQNWIAPWLHKLPGSDTTQRLATETFAAYKLQILAAWALRDMLLKSLHEDTYGRAHRDVLRILTECFNLLHLVVAYTGKFCSKDQRPPEEPEALKSALLSCIKEVGLVFEDFVDFKQQPGLLAQIQSMKDSTKK